MKHHRVWMLFSLLTLHHVCCDREEGTGEDVEYAAIKTIHRQLDDNADGSVDFSESAEFVETELCDEEAGSKTACMGSEKSLKFHLTDTQITSNELWVTWHKNEVFNWTNQDVLQWLVHHVDLPEYSDAFLRNQITGRQLPYIAINSGQILQNTLSIMDGQHKQKIQLRAMDAILFGPPVMRGHWKDTILEISLFFFVCGTIYALWQRRISKTRMDSFIEDLRLKEEEITKLKSKFEAIERESTDGLDQEDIHDHSPLMMSPVPPHSSGSDEDTSTANHCKWCSSQGSDSQSVLSQAHENMDLLQRRVWLLEEELDSRNRVLQSLQQLLPECQQREREQLEFRKSVGEEQMARAQRACEKIRKRRSSLFGSFHLANSSVLDEAGLQITKAVNKMQLISEYFEEHHKRWNRIGHACGFHIYSPGCKSPQSPTRESSASSSSSSSLLNHHDLRYTHRFFNERLSDIVHSSSSSSAQAFNRPNSDPLAGKDRGWRGQGFTMPPQGTQSSPAELPFQKRHSLSVISQFTTPDRARTDSVESSLSSCSSATQISRTSANYRSISLGDGEQQAELNERWTRGGSVDSGKKWLQSLDTDKKPVMVGVDRRKKFATPTTLEEENLTEKVCPSPQTSPRPQGVRNRVKVLSTLTSNV